MLGVCAATFCLRRQSRGRLLIVARVRERVCHVHRARCSSSASRRYTSGRPSMEESQKPHPFLREPLLYILNLPAYVSDTALAQAFEACVPFRPHIARDGADGPVSGSIEFKELEKGELFCPSLAHIRRYVFCICHQLRRAICASLSAFLFTRGSYSSEYNVSNSGAARSLSGWPSS